MIAKISLLSNVLITIWLFFTPVAGYAAVPLTLSAINFTSQSSDKLQIQLELSDTAVTPKIFKTDNPARIVLDFVNVKNGLTKKIYPINQGSALNAYVIEADGRVRVILNLLDTTPFEMKTEGNKILLTLTPNVETKTVFTPQSPAKLSTTETTKSTNAMVSAFIPEQAISGFDFRRGDKSEGRILVSLANPNTLINSKKEGGKVIISFLNTQLPNGLAKRLDVSEFATPVKFIDTTSVKQETTLTVTTVNELYDYSVLQTDGLLTIEFRPLADEEKENERLKYTGDRLSLNFQDIEIRNIISILAEFTGKNMIASDDVTGNITLKLDDIPWDEALDFIMMTKELGKYQTGNVTLISPLDKIKDYKNKQQKMEEVIEKSDALVTEYLKINYAKAESFKNLLNGLDTGAFGSCGADNETSSSSSAGAGSSIPGNNQQNQNNVGNLGNNQQNQNNLGNDEQNQNNTGNNNRQNQNKRSNEEINPPENRLLSVRGSATVDSRTNTLIVKDMAKKLEEVKKLIYKLDVPVQQVMIESRIVIADDSFAKNLGVKFGAAKQGVVGGNTGYAIGGAGTKGSASPSSDGSVGVLNDSLVDLGAGAIGSTPVGALGMTLAKGADYVLNLEVQALQSDGRGESISNPRVMTMNRCTAHIQQGVQIPYTTGGTSTTSANTRFQDALLSLNVTPQITPSGAVLMNLVIKKDNANTSISVNGNVAIDKRELQTSVLVKDGETIVLGGVYEDSDSLSKNKIPFFADLPWIGYLFTNSANKNSKKELLIFVTPKIVKDNVAAQ